MDLAAGTEDLDICGKETTDFRRNERREFSEENPSREFFGIAGIT